MVLSLGVDIGRDRDATAIALVDETDGRTPDESRIIWLRKADLLETTPFVAQEAAVREYHRRYRIHRIVIDATGMGQQMAEDLGRQIGGTVVAFKFTEQSKGDLIAVCYDYFTSSRLRVPQKHRRILEELSNVRKETSPAGKVLYRDEPHGDLAWALMLALWGLPRHKAGPVFWEGRTLG